MCGIAAIFAYRDNAPPVDQEELLRIREAMLKRGPDGAGLWMSGDRRIGLAHRRLAIIDLSDAGAQPMATHDGAVRIVFNGEIYNYRELRQRLEMKGYRFHSQSDTEVLLHLYQEYDTDMVEHLRSMYAFAIWDQNKRGLFLARDPFGIKPLYYADNGTTIRVASQVKALLKGGEIDTSPEPAGHVGFYLWGHVPEPYTLYRGIRALPAGSTFWVDTAGHKEGKQVFNLTAELAKSSEARLKISQEEMHQRLRTALLDTVLSHLVADVPIGVFLSAGLDSTTMAALAKEVGTTDLRTITLGFKEFHSTPCDEVPLAELVAKQYGTVHQTRWVRKEDFQKERDGILDAMDQPSTDGVNTYFVSKAAAEAGLKVAISGLGGDELFGGYPSFKQIPRMVKTLSPFRSASFVGKGFCFLTAPILKHFTSPKYAGLLEYGGTFGGAYLLRRGMFMPWELPDLLDAEMVREGWEELKTLSRLEATTQGITNPHIKVTALETAWYMRNQLLRDSDWASMAHSLEIRVPLVDIPLLRAVVPLLASCTPPRKHHMASVARHALPKEILEREKTGFSIPVREWLMETSAAASRERGLRGWVRYLLPHERRTVQKDRC
jgi:asparagine synthase (glutamine-hydrolysing)